MENQAKQLQPQEAVEALQQAFGLIKAAVTSRHIVFTSPAPSSTEAAAKTHILRAASELEMALALMQH